MKLQPEEIRNREVTQWRGVGERLTLADICWFITLTRLASAGYPLKNHPHLHEHSRRLATNGPPVACSVR